MPFLDATDPSSLRTGPASIGSGPCEFIDGIHGDYDKGRPEIRPKYLNEAFWPDQEHADRFRQWLMSAEGKEFRRQWFSSVTNHTVLRYVDAAPDQPVTDD